MNRLSFAAVSLIALLAAAPALAYAPQQAPVIDQASVAAHMASWRATNCRGAAAPPATRPSPPPMSLTQFRLAGLTPVPGMDGYLQRAPVVKTTPSGHGTLTVGGVAVSQGSDLAILSGGLGRVRRLGRRRGRGRRRHADG